VRTFGPATVYAKKMRIVFQTRARFAGVLVRKNRLEIGLWLKRRREHPRLYRIEFYPPNDWYTASGWRIFRRLAANWRSS
jgi:hypothetical protein